MKIYFLGTNGWFDTKTGNTICVLIDTPDEYVILDAGNGIYKADQYIKDKNKPIYLFISHLHLDHIIGLHVLAKFNFPQGIKMFVQEGKAKDINTFVAMPYTAPFSLIRTKVDLIELSPNISIPCLEKSLPLRHKGDSLGLRFNFGGKIITYIADTGVCDNVYELSKNADLLISECAFLSGQKKDEDIEEWPHLNPELAAEIAKKSRAKKLVLVHFDAAIYQTIKARVIAEKKAQAVFKKTKASCDNLVIKL